MTDGDRGYRRFIVRLVERALGHNPHLLAVNHWLVVRGRDSGVEGAGRNLRLVYGRKADKSKEGEKEVSTEPSNQAFSCMQETTQD